MKYELQILIGMVAAGLFIKKPDWRTGFFLFLFIVLWVAYNKVKN